jgi:hypothetical protein
LFAGLDKLPVRDLEVEGDVAVGEVEYIEGCELVFAPRAPDKEQQKKKLNTFLNKIDKFRASRGLTQDSTDFNSKNCDSNED